MLCKAAPGTLAQNVVDHHLTAMSLRSCDSFPSPKQHSWEISRQQFAPSNMPLYSSRLSNSIVWNHQRAGQSLHRPCLRQAFWPPAILPRVGLRVVLSKAVTPSIIRGYSVANSSLAIRSSRLGNVFFKHLSSKKDLERTNQCDNIKLRSSQKSHCKLQDPVLCGFKQAIGKHDH